MCSSILKVSPVKQKVLCLQLWALYTEAGFSLAEETILNARKY